VTTPNRVTRTYTQRLVAGPGTVFPLMCPVREAEWLDGWDPLVVYSNSGVAEADCVFLTPATPLSAVWYISRHEPENGFVEMIKIVPTVTATKLTIHVRPAKGGSTATITYSHTSLGASGDAIVARFTKAYYREFMREWETQVNHFLAHGSALRAGQASVAKAQPRPSARASAATTPSGA